MDKLEILALIPARGKSKSIPKKNIREFAGHPLVAYSITAALQSKLVTRVIVSTDSEEIAAVARTHGAGTPFMRPAELAQDDTMDFPVFAHALRWLADNEGYHPDLVVQLRATSPIYPRDLIDDAISTLLAHPHADSVRGVVPSSQNPYKMWKVAEDGRLLPLLKVDGIKEAFNSPRQSLPDTFWQTGHIDVIRTSTILEQGSLSGSSIYPVYIHPDFSVDIDTVQDWRRAEQMVTEGRLDMVFPGSHSRAFPEDIRLLVLDFDGVMTDDRVYVNAEGAEMVAASRSDGFGLERLRMLTDIEVVVMSKETNPVVAARCRKLNLPVFQSVENKKEALTRLIQEKGIASAQVMFVGNDLNDVPCFPEVGYAAAPADANPVALRAADLILEKKGGKGAVREVCEILIKIFINNH